MFGCKDAKCRDTKTEEKVKNLTEKMRSAMGYRAPHFVSKLIRIRTEAGMGATALSDRDSKRGDQYLS